MSIDQNSNNSKAGVGPAGDPRRKPHRLRRWLIGLVLMAVIGVSLVVAAMTDVRSAGSVQETVPVRRGDLTVTVTESGSIRAGKSIQYKCQVERRRGGTDVTILDIVPAGTYVTQEDVDKGMVLVELDSSTLEDQLQEEEMELASDQENFTASKESYDIQVIQNESDIAAGQLEVRFALLDLQKYLGKTLAARLIEDSNQITDLTAHVKPILDQVRDDPNLLDGSAAGQALKGFQDEIVLAAGNLKTAQDTLAGSERLHQAEYVSDLELERDRLNVTSRQFSEENARVSLELFLSYDFPKNAEQYLSNYVEAGRKLERTHAQCRSRLAQAQAALSNAEERLQSQTKYVQDLKQQIGYCTIRAQAPGLVIYGTGGSDDMFRAMRGGGGGGIIAEGETVYEGQTILSMPDTAAMVAEVSVHETEVDKVRTGQPVVIVMDAFPDRLLHGRVLEVAPLPDQQRGWMNPDLKVYKTLVSIDGSHDFLKTRMSCKVEMLVRQLKDVLLVPIQVVAHRGGRKVCYVMTPSGPEEREVQTGAFTDVLAQIVEGIEEGERVLLNPPLFADASSDAAFQRSQQWSGQPPAEGVLIEGQPAAADEPASRGRPAGDTGGMRQRGGPPAGADGAAAGERSFQGRSREGMGGPGARGGAPAGGDGAVSGERSFQGRSRPTGGPQEQGGRGEGDEGSRPGRGADGMPQRQRGGSRPEASGADRSGGGPQPEQQ